MTQRFPLLWFWAAAFAIPLWLAGCAKAGPAPGVGFVDPAPMTPPQDLPFHRAWVKPDLEWDRYTEIRIAEVDTSHLAQMDWWKLLERRGSFKEDSRRLADYARRRFEEAFREDEEGRFEVVETAGPQTLVLELALTEIVPSKIVLNTLGYAPFVGSAFKLLRNAKSKSTVAFEARLRDGATGEILATYADREWEKSSPLNVKDVTWYGHAESIIAEWADQFVRALRKRPGEVIRDSQPFQLKPW